MLERVWKTVLTATIIDDILCRRLSTERVSFFFCRFDEEQSLKSRIILGSLLRQAIETGPYFLNLETRLTALLEHTDPDAEDFEPLFTDVIESCPKQYLIVDGLDECAKTERTLILRFLEHVFSRPLSKVKIFLAGRDSVGQDLEQRFGIIYHRSMKSQEVQRDIEAYTKDMIREKYDGDELMIGKKELLSDIQKALIKGAQGMLVPFYPSDSGSSLAYYSKFSS